MGCAGAQQLWESFSSSQAHPCLPTNSEGERNAVNQLCLQKTTHIINGNKRLLGREGRMGRARVVPDTKTPNSPLRKELHQHSVIYEHKYPKTQSAPVWWENIPWLLPISSSQSPALPTVPSKNTSRNGNESHQHLKVMEFTALVLSFAKQPSCGTWKEKGRELGVLGRVH